MNIKGNLKYILTGTLVFLTIYMFLAAFPTGPSMYLAPVWTADISAAGAGTEAAESVPVSIGAEAFKIQNRFGYFTPEGKVLLSRQTDKRSAVSTASWAEYPDDAESTAVYSPDGTLQFEISAAGFVHLDDGRAYLFLPGGDGLSQYGSDGTLLWTREHSAPITAFNSSPAATIIGYADGSLTAIRPDGSEIFSFYPGGSDLEVILGAAVSEDGSLAACVSGIDRQRFILIRIKDGQYKIVHHQWLEGNLRRQVYVDFEDTGTHAFFECAGGLGIADAEALSVSIIPVHGKVIAVGTNAGSGLFTALTQDGQDCEVVVIERPRYLVAKTRFKARDAFLIQRGSTIYLGTDTLISRIDIRGIE